MKSFHEELLKWVRNEARLAGNEHARRDVLDGARSYFKGEKDGYMWVRWKIEEMISARTFKSKLRN